MKTKMEDYLMYTKEQQLLKIKAPKISTIEREYLNWLQEQQFGCILCNTFSHIEMHHVKMKSTDKKNHKRLIPLCTEHHKGKVLSPHGTSRKWRLHISMESQNKVADELYNTFLESR